MSEPYKKIGRAVAKRLKLIMADVDGTLTTGETIGPPASDVIRLLEQQGISVGLVSGRPLPRLESQAKSLEISGPIIGENGGVARLSLKDGLVDLGLTRSPALEGLKTLKKNFGDAIEELPDNKDRHVDVSIALHGVEKEELKRHLQGVQLLDSGFMLHLLPEGTSKGNTLKALLAKYLHLEPGEVMVFGDSATDASLFDNFSNSVLVINPMLSGEQRQSLSEIAGYRSEHEQGHGFAEVGYYILKLRS